MSSSSSDSDSDGLEPIRRIKINIKPKDAAAKKHGADVDAIKASVEAWRPLGPRPHQSLARRQSSLSSVSSLSMGAGLGSSSTCSNATTATTPSFTSANANPYLHQYQSSKNTTATTTYNMANNHCMRSSPSCSSLVNEFNNRSSFANFMPNASRTSSPLTFMQSGGGTSNLGDTVPIALAIQESIELTVKGQQKNQLLTHSSTTGTSETTQFETRALGNIKVAFPNAFARMCSSGGKPIAPLKLRLHSTENIIRYFASGLIRDLDSESSSLTESLDSTFTNGNNNNNSNHNSNSDAPGNSNGQPQSRRDFKFDLFDMNESPTKIKVNIKVIEFDMEALAGQLKQHYDQTPNSRYYNLDVLRYQIAPVDQFEKCPLQVCAYWKLDPELIKLRVDFKHSSQSGLTLERLREISFKVNLSNLVPENVKIMGVAPNQISTLIKPSNIRNTGNSLNTDNYLENVCKSMTGNVGPQSLFGDHHNSQQSQPIVSPNQTQQQSKNSISNLIDEPNKTQEDLSGNLLVQSDAKSSQAPTSHHANNQPLPAPRQLNSNKSNSSMLIRLPPPPSRHHHDSRSENLTQIALGADTLKRHRSPLVRNTSSNSSGRSDILSLYDQPNELNHDKFPAQAQAFPLGSMLSLNLHQQTGLSGPVAPQAQAKPAESASPNLTASANQPTVPYITYEPQAIWCDQTRQLIWKFDNLLSFYKNDGYGSLLAKLDFRHCANGMLAKTTTPTSCQEDKTPKALDVKFLVVDSTLSKVSLSIDSAGYRMTLLKKEVRSGRYKSEPCIF